MRFLKWLPATLVALCALSGQAEAQVISEVDSLRLLPSNFTIPNPAVSTNFRIAVFIKSATTLGAIAVPLKYGGHPNLRVDASINNLAHAGITQGPAGASANWTLRTSFIDSSANKGILIGYVSFGAVPPANDTLCYVNFAYTTSAQSAVISLDSGIVNNQHLGITDVLANEFIPRWSKGTITIGTPQPTILLNPTSMVFNATIGTANPASQPLAITNTGAGTLSWTAISTQPWLSVNPSSGSGNGNPNVAVNMAGLAAGTHTGWIIVSDPAASNTPESLFVSLNLSGPNLTSAPTSLTFNGVVGNPNPAAQNVQLSASQGAAIAWTGTKSQAWLSFNPTSGTTPNNLSVSVDTTGLLAGIYRDTIVITSANAANSPWRIPVTFDLKAPPAIALSPQTLSFNGVQGGPNPAPDTVLLSNSGPGVMDFAAVASESWLSVSPGAGAAPASLQVSVNLAGVIAGSYTGYVVVTSSVGVNSPETVTVALEVSSAPPFLSVAPTTASFSATEGDLIGSPASTAFIIDNTGSGTLAWSILGMDSAWVQLSKLSGGGPDTLLVSVNPAGLVTGTYQEVFEIADPSAQGSPVACSVTLEVLPGPPTISVAPGTLSFSAVQGGPSPSAQPLNITNVGGSQPLDWTATKSQNQSWLLLSAASGTAPSLVNVSVNITGQGIGTYFDTIVVASDTATNSPQLVPVTLEIQAPPPTIAVSPDSLTFTATLGDPNPSAQALGIDNVGGGTLDWSLVPEGSWLFAGPLSGTAPSNVDVSVNLAGLVPGTYVGALVVSGTGATNSPVRVPVVLELSDLDPVLAVNPLSLQFSAQEGGANPASQSFHISNEGGGLLQWSVSTAATWISQLDPPSGTNDDDVAVSVNVSGLSAGTFTDSVLVNAGGVNGSPQYVLVTLELAPPPPPQIVLSPETFSFTALLGAPNPPGQDLNITNGGGRELNWSATNSSGWLSLTETSGTAPSLTTLDVDIAGLGIGVYYDTVVVTSDSATNSPQMATVELQVVNNPPALAVTPTTLYFEKVKGDPDPPCQQVNISNTGAGALNWTATKKSSWLMLSSASGTAPSTIDFCVVGPTLVAGTYRDTVVIESPGALNAPQKVIVTFVVKSVAKPALVLQPDSLYFELLSGSHSETQCIYVFVNGNGGRLVWRTHTSASWLEVTPDSCNISHPLCVTANAEGLAPGMYCDSVEVSGDASNSPQYLAVCLNVLEGGEQPLLATDPTQISVTVPVGSAMQFRQLSILNVGTGSLTWSINPGLLATWLSVTATGGAAPGSTQVQLNPTGLAAGTYFDTIVVASAQAGNSPVGVPVVFTLTGEQVAGDSVRVGSDTASPGSIAVIPVFFDNVQPLFGVTVPLTWSGVGVWADSVSFVGSRATDSDIRVGSADSGLNEIRIGLIPSTIDPVPIGSGLLANVYFTVADWAPNQVIQIDSVTTSAPAISLSFVDTSTTEYVPGFRPGHLVVTGAEPPALFVSPDSLHFSGTAGGANPPAQYVHVDNMGGSYLTFVASESVPWLSINPTSGDQGDSVFFTVNLAGLSQDLYVGTVRFISPEALDTVDVAVTLNVGAQVNPPVLVLSPSSLNFSMVTGVLPASQAITVLNSGGGTLSWTATKTQPWFAIAPNTGAAGQVVTVSITNAALAVGTYKDTITFVDPGASNSPRKAGITLVVTGPPKADSVRVAHVFADPGDTVLVGVSVKNTFDVSGITLPFKYTGTGVKLVSGAVTARSGPAFFTIFTELRDTVNQTGLYGFISFGAGMPVGDGDVLIMKFAIAPGAPDQVIQIDTTLLPPNNHLVLNDALANEIFPDFVMGTITVGSGGGSSIWVNDVTGSAGEQVEVEVFVNNTSPVDGLTLPLKLSSPDTRIVSVDFSGMPSELGVPSFIVYNEQLFTLKVDWSGTTPLAPGSRAVARFKIELDENAPSQLVYIDTAGEYGLRLAGGSQNVEVPSFARGTITLEVSTAADDPALPWAFGLDPNYPNPFNPTTQISFTLSSASDVRLEVFNTLGRRVATLVDGFRSPGQHVVTWDGRDAHGSSVPSGVYLYRLTAGPETALRKMTLLK